jgi:hypothetical protein
VPLREYKTYARFLLYIVVLRVVDAATHRLLPSFLRTLISTYRVSEHWYPPTGCQNTDIHLQDVRTLISAYWATGRQNTDIHLQGVRTLISATGLQDVRTLISMYRASEHWYPPTGRQNTDIRLQGIRTLISTYRASEHWYPPTGRQNTNIRLQGVRTLISTYRAKGHQNPADHNSKFYYLENPNSNILYCLIFFSFALLLEISSWFFYISYTELLRSAWTACDCSMIKRGWGELRVTSNFGVIFRDINPLVLSYSELLFLKWNLGGGAVKSSSDLCSNYLWKLLGIWV